MTFVIQAQPALNVHWASTSEAVMVEYADPATRQLNERIVFIKRNGTNDYLCYRAWALVY